ncbi:MAG: SDR family NAD(P)-dependent oxidoreductase [Chelatococcus sp.]|uniref:SDR family NAD(P)-dependent oxidoreductase n=1 Tax=Chelatococcus sp. TaxID=1953771 RepID=UPI0025C6B769|nr:SDR family NAD(P)-dependent oxidoreductase [Chelatococcus sp.]MBX3538189.1 SDR family NAD(P)-dependent oxidoreductase [Chelatococcus sp.]
MTDRSPPSLLLAPRRKNPLLRTPQPLLPPQARSRTALGLLKPAAEGRFALQVCGQCGTVAYPPRDACGHCLSADLALRDVDPRGTLVCETSVGVPSEPYFRERAPWRTGIVVLDAGPRVIAHLHGACREGGVVRLALKLDKGGRPVMIALPPTDRPAMADDPVLRELTASPKFRRVLVTDGRGAVGQAVTRSLVKAGAAKVFVGIAEDWKPFPGEDALRSIPAVELVPLDVSDEISVHRLAASLGAKTDILVNTVEHVRPGGVIGRDETVMAQDVMERCYFGLMRLARSFGPVMMSRGADGANSAVAWVNALSVFALVNWPAWGAYSAAQAAALSLSQCLRAELRPGGIRVINAFSGPLETEWFQAVPPPKVTPSVLASGIVRALENGLEDAFIGDVALDIRDRLAANPKAVERELANEA